MPEHNKAKLLFVDDEVLVRDFYDKTLGKHYRILQAGSGKEGLEIFEKENPDVVILDISMPEMSGIEVCRELRERTKDGPYIAIILLTGKNDPKQLVEGFDAGADDYCLKPISSEEIKARIQANLRIKRITDQLKNANIELERLSITDHLTGLYNMRHFNFELDVEFAKATRYNFPLSLIMMDLDFFKEVNDKCDHLMGSFVISEAGKRIREMIRDVDIAARYGGDEYIVLLPHTDEEGAHITAERILKKIRGKKYSKYDYTVEVTTSMGIATYHGESKDMQNATKLMQKADEMLYKAKENGRNQIVDS